LLFLHGRNESLSKRLSMTISRASFTAREILPDPGKSS
jgi:hypothetical protein